MTITADALGADAAGRLAHCGGDVTIAAGLTDAELDAVEHDLGFTFADDHRAFLRRVLPVGPGWPPWRTPHDSGLARQLRWPVDGVLFDVEHADEWFEEWGPRPSDLATALAAAERRLAAAPRMVPVYGHRYLPAGRGTFGHPVLSMYQTDIVCYGPNLADYLEAELTRRRGPAADYRAPSVPFWSGLVS